MKKVFLMWIPFVLILSFFSFVVYIVVGQSVRSAANDTQAEVIEHVLREVYADPHLDLTRLLGPVIDIKENLAPFVIVFNNGGVPVASSAVLNGGTPVPPAGVFKYLLKHDDHRFTWQPEKGVRIAVVMRKLEGEPYGFILAGRSLREVERRKGEMGFLVVLSFVVGLGATFIYSYIVSRKVTHHK